MIINEIHYNGAFKKQFLKLPRNIQKKAVKLEQLFREKPFHPSLRLYKLKGKLNGLWSISIDKRYRLIFEPLTKSRFLFVSIGIHSIYESN